MLFENLYFVVKVWCGIQ